jgi:hypothetical protein
MHPPPATPPHLWACLCFPHTQQGLGQWHNPRPFNYTCKNESSWWLSCNDVPISDFLDQPKCEYWLDRSAIPHPGGGRTSLSFFDECISPPPAPPSPPPAPAPPKLGWCEQRHSPFDETDSQPANTFSNVPGALLGLYGLYRLESGDVSPRAWHYIISLHLLVIASVASGFHHWWPDITNGPHGLIEENTWIRLADLGCLDLLLGSLLTHSISAAATVLNPEAERLRHCTALLGLTISLASVFVPDYIIGARWEYVMIIATLITNAPVFGSHLYTFVRIARAHATSAHVHAGRSRKYWRTRRIVLSYILCALTCAVALASQWIEISSGGCPEWLLDSFLTIGFHPLWHIAGALVVYQCTVILFVTDHDEYEIRFATPYCWFIFHLSRTTRSDLESIPAPAARADSVSIPTSLFLDEGDVVREDLIPSTPPRSSTRGHRRSPSSPLPKRRATMESP